MAQKTDNTTAKRQIIQRTKEKRQTTIYKAFHEKLKNEQHEPR
jgi:hypothetical protein